MSVREEVAQQTLEVVTPNHQVFASVRGDSWGQVRFAPGFYERVSTSEMSDQLARVLKLLVVARTRALYDGYSRSAGERVVPGSTRGPQAAEYSRRLAELTAEGAAADGDLVVHSVGLMHFVVSIAPGLMDRLSEDEFCRACESAAFALLADQHRKIAELKFEIYYRPLLEAAGVTGQA